jgi:hypothetical protein
MAFEIASQSAVLFEYHHRAFAFQVPHYVGNSILWRNRKANVDMIAASSGLNYFYPFVLAQLPEYIAYLFSQLAINYFSPVLGNPNNMIFAFPTRM